MKVWVYFLSLFVALQSSGAVFAQDPVPLCTMTDAGSHYDVVLNFETGATHRQIGEAYGAMIRKVAPDFERLLDSYINEYGGNWFIYKILLRRVKQVRESVAQEYRDEIEGIASQLSGGEHDRPGDGKISVNELYAFNLLGDVARLYQCSALGVYGASSADGKTLIGRNFDWPDGKDHQLAKIQCVTTFLNGPHSFTNIACIGFQGAVTAFNSSRLFAGVLDSPTGGHYSASNKRSYLLDLRTALETCSTMQEVADYMTDPKKRYTCNHLIALADSDTFAVLENDVSRGCKTCHRGLRSGNSEVRPEMVWDIPDSLGVVNCFALKENEDNHVDPTDRKSAKGDVPAEVNMPRYDNMRKQLKARGPKIDAGAMEKIMSYYQPELGGYIHKGGIFNQFTMQGVVFEPANFALNVYFRPKDGTVPSQMSYEAVAVPFSGATQTAKGL